MCLIVADLFHLYVSFVCFFVVYDLSDFPVSLICLFVVNVHEFSHVLLFCFCL